MRRALPALSLLSVLVLAACGSPGPRSSSPTAKATPTNPNPAVVQKRGGGYYMDDGPGDSPPPNLELTPDAVPRDEPPLKSAANRPYVVFGKTYTPTISSQSFRQRGIASWYGRKFHGQRTSSGEPYDMYGMTAAHPTLPIPSYVRVTNLSNGRMVVVKVNDRGPFHSERIIDLSYTAAYKLGYLGQGSTMVEIEQVHGDGTPLPPVLVATAPGTANASPVPVVSASSQAPIVASANTSAAMVNPVTPTAQPAPVLMPSDNLNTASSGAGTPVVVTAPVAETRATLPGPASLPPSPAPATQVLPTSTQPDGVYLQLGAFGARDGADEFRTKVYQQLGWLNDTVYIVARDRLFRVQVGPYKDRAAAAAVAEKIRETLQFTPMFVLK